MSDAPADRPALPPLDAVEARILGALVEKQATTPEAYPLTANAVQLACNQKNNREPVMELEAGEIGHALRAMEQRGLVRSVHGARAQRYEHRFAQAYSVTLKQQALLSVLLLRGAQTAAELLARCERLQAFDGADEVRDTLERLQQRGLALRVARGAGQREDRYVHLLCGPVDEATLPPPAPARRVESDGTLEARVRELEARVARLEAALGGAPDADEA
jgi:uncharacterized protein YceH (UPF0502 family)